MFVFVVCLVLGAISVEAEVVFGLPALYNNYHGEYASAYNNYEPRPYAFEYGVSDPHTGDHKTQWETKDKAGVVRGSYSLLEPDGSTRIVDYIADDHGFRAVVRKIGIHGQSVESHGGAVEEAGLIQPIVVADIEPVSVNVQQPVHVAQPLQLEQPLSVQQPVQIEQAPIFQSYDGGAEHYQNLLQPQPYSLQIPRAEGIYVETPSYAHYSAEPYLRDNNYIQQLPAAPKQDIYLQEPQTAPIVAVPNAELYYTQNTEVGNPQGRSVVTFYQPEGAIQSPNQNQQQYPVQNVNLIEPYQNQLPIQNYELKQNFPRDNQLLAQSQEQNYGQLSGGTLYPYGESSQNQGYQGITGNLQDDSEYTNYDQRNNAQLVLNQGEYILPGKYGTPLPLQK